MKHRPNKTRPYHVRFEKDQEKFIEQYMEEKDIYDYSLAIRQLVRRAMVYYKQEKQRQGEERDWREQMK
jgi:hypothetical protein